MTQTATATRTKVNVAPPPMYKVVYVNDNTTTFQFVAESLMEHFDYPRCKAEAVTVEVDRTGSAVVAILPFEIAEQKTLEVTLDARRQGFPFQVRVERED